MDSTEKAIRFTQAYNDHQLDALSRTEKIKHKLGDSSHRITGFKRK